jgi:hypothetical protein
MRLVAVVCKLAWCDLRRNHRRTLILSTAVPIRVSAMISTTALMRRIHGRGMVNATRLTLLVIPAVAHDAS